MIFNHQFKQVNQPHDHQTPKLPIKMRIPWSRTEFYLHVIMLLYTLPSAMIKVKKQAGSKPRRVLSSFSNATIVIEPLNPWRLLFFRKLATTTCVAIPPLATHHPQVTDSEPCKGGKNSMLPLINFSLRMAVEMNMIQMFWQMWGDFFFARPGVGSGTRWFFGTTLGGHTLIQYTWVSCVINNIRSINDFYCIRKKHLLWIDKLRSHE